VDGLTALMMASWWGYAAVVHLLLRHPYTDVNAQNEVGPWMHPYTDVNAPNKVGPWIHGVAALGSLASAYCGFEDFLLIIITRQITIEAYL